VLRSTKLPIAKAAAGTTASLPRGDAAYWELATMGMDFDHADRLPAAAFNRALACGLLRTRGCSSTETRVAVRDPGDDD